MRTKQQILQELRQSRLELSHHGQQAVVEWSPQQVMKRSLAKHRFIWIGAAAAVGALVIVRVLPKQKGNDENERDKSPSAATKNAVFPLLFAPIVASLRKALFSQGRDWLINSVNQQFLNRQVSDDTP